MSSTSSSGVNPEMKLFSEVNDFCDSIFGKIKEEEAKLPYHINIIDLLRAGENAHSRILGRLLEQKNDKNYQILDSFLCLLKKKNDNFSSLNVQEPTISCEKGRIDILIKDKNYTIIFENKIHNAIDRDKQIEKYINKLTTQYKDNQIYVLYLSADGRKEPTAESWGKYKGTDFEKKRYIQLTFKDDILNWLKEDILPNIRIKDIHLKSAIEQYTDHLEGFFNLRTIQKLMNIKLQEEILTQLNIKENSVQEKLTVLNQKIDDIERVKNQLAMVKSQIEVEFLKECYYKLKNDFPNYEIINNTDHKDHPNAVLKMKKDDYLFGVLIERSSYSGKIYYGIGRHFSSGLQEENIKKFFSLLFNEEGKFISDSDFWYGWKYTSYDGNGYNEFKEFVEKVIKYCKDNPLEK
ncbi:PD-(D/E)XK nuclease family protein [Capnocytophaga catalasegens]|uniref:PD-(D/E)XK nuclease superfamily protein n=1 Tax=Capnocytophaga catalasegens TaxID=1004260 RepID=A0AAV5AT71_9FLAO|nr:PD-(D/E)XK nuclease family protein [Capnocytophaga catalasegens]GIZ15335.1 hypothetical protein RCZ03_13350 [Capnocytophaga catalasegens]GJM50502.1 hypothetical protein RCZ15_14750 [Capnocytophaga catalasegens]GJM52106.1 hypothetical protein RCZ16_04240 [Capnocytophaga catalasegens]